MLYKYIINTTLKNHLNYIIINTERFLIKKIWKNKISRLEEKMNTSNKIRTKQK